MQKAITKQKKLIVVALAAAAFSAPALAETGNVSIYGVADLSYDFINNGTSAAGVAGASKSNVSSNISKLGFKGAESLSDGLSAIWQIEQQINIDNSAAATALASRNSFLGLKSDSFGTVLLGRHDTPYKLSTRKLDPFNDSIADGRALLSVVAGKSAGYSFDGRQADSVYYTTPVMSGFTGLIAYANLNEAAATTPVPGTATGKNSLFSLAGMYNVAPFFGSFAYEEHKLETFRADGKESAWKLGLGYTLNAFTLGFSYEKSNDSLGASSVANVGAACNGKTAGSECFGHNAYLLSGVYKMDMNAINFTYGKLGQTGTIANTGANQIGLGYDYGLSKRTKLYAIYSRISNKSASSYGFSQSTAAAGTINGVGASPSVVSLGIKHSF
ncbi:MAG: porin [Gallionella sp.]|nr:porin [Gallionella sp.]